jgi:hypothetical protein
MSTKSGKPTVRKRGKVTPFHADYQRRQQAETQLRWVNQRLARAAEWAPLLALLAPGSEPGDVLSNLRKRQRRLLADLAPMRSKGIGEPGGPNGLGLPGWEPDFDSPRFRDAVITMRYLEHLLANRLDGTLQLGNSGSDAPQAWTATLWSYVLDQYPGIYWSDNGASYSGSWDFDPYRDVTRGIIGHKGSVTADAPPFYKPWEDAHHAQLMHLAALAFDVPAQPWDAMVSFDAPVAIAVNLDVNADNAFLIAQAVLCVQPDASAGSPTGIEHFNAVQPSIVLDEPSGFKSAVESPTVSGTYFARANTRSRVHIGLHWNLTVTNGQAGTSGGWDSLVIFQPQASEVWGLHVTMVPVQ